jgi:hypothetical protein
VLDSHRQAGDTDIDRGRKSTEIQDISEAGAACRRRGRGGCSGNGKLMGQRVGICVMGLACQPRAEVKRRRQSRLHIWDVQRVEREGGGN